MLKLRNLIISIAIPILFGILGNFLGDSSGFDNIIKPSFSPPAIVFPIVRTILYTLMGISSYIIYQSNDPNKRQALVFYGIQLVLNSLWTFFFFNLELFFFSFIWILIILLFVIIMIYKFYKIDKTAAFLQIPYALWLVFASILNFSIFLLNR